MSGDSQIEVTESHTAQVGAMEVRRALPRRARRTVGAWCFADHMGPVALGPGIGADIGPHPHAGLQTVTWLVAGELLHRDSLGSEQSIRPGQLNLMTAGLGVSHAEESPTGRPDELHGIQLWVAQPEATRHGPPAFEHHAALPRAEFPNAIATVLVGDLAGTSSPARHDSDHLGAELAIRPGRTAIPLEAAHEHGLIVLAGEIAVLGAGADERAALSPGRLGYLAPGAFDLTLEATAPATVMLLGGTPFPERLYLWWNFVARSAEEARAAQASWADDDGRFGTVATALPRTPAPAFDR